MRDQIARDKIKELVGDLYYDRNLRKSSTDAILLQVDKIEEKLSALVDCLNLEWHETKIEKGFKKKRGR